MTVGDPLKDVENRVYYSIGPEVRERQADPKDGDKPWTRAVAMCRSDDVAREVVDLLNAGAEYAARPRRFFLTPDQVPKLDVTVATPPETPPAVCTDVYARNYLTKMYGYLVRNAHDQDKDPTDIPAPNWEEGDKSKAGFPVTMAQAADGVKAVARYFQRLGIEDKVAERLARQWDTAVTEAGNVDEVRTPSESPRRTTCRRSSNCQQRDGHDGECKLEYP